MKASRSITRLSLVVAFALSGCATATAPPFEFGNYDTGLYVYSKHPEKLPVFEEALTKAIEKGRESGRVAPGLQAELGYCYLHDGKRAEALAQFKAEMALFPESIPFLTSIVAQNGG